MALKRTLRWLKASPLRFIAASVAALWLLDILGEYVIRGSLEGWVSPGQWWFELDSESTAAWVQSLGSLLAIAIAIIVPASIHNEERRAVAIQAESKLKALVARLIPAIRDFISSVEMIPRGLDSIHESLSQNKLEFSSATAMVQMFRVGVVDVVRRYQNELEILDTEDAVAIIRSIDEGARFNEHLASYIAQLRSAPPGAQGNEYLGIPFVLARSFVETTAERLVSQIEGLSQVADRLEHLYLAR